MLKSFIKFSVYTSIAFIAATNTVSGQRVHFHDFSVDTIEIYSSSGAYHFDQPGTTTGLRDQYLIGFDNETGFYCVEYKRFFTKMTIEPESEKTTEKRISSHLSIENYKLDSLLASLSVKY